MNTQQTNQDDQNTILIKKKTKFLLDFEYPLDLIKIIISYQECLVCDQNYPIIIDRLLSKLKLQTSISDKIELNFDNSVKYEFSLDQNHPNSQLISFRLEQRADDKCISSSNYWNMKINLETFISCVIHEIPIHKMDNAHNKMHGNYINKKHDNAYYTKNKHGQNNNDYNKYKNIDANLLMEFHWRIISFRLKNYLISGDDSHLEPMKFENLVQMYQNFISTHFHFTHLKDHNLDTYLEKSFSYENKFRNFYFLCNKLW
jgi:hypothetical protein